MAMMAGKGKGSVRWAPRGPHETAQGVGINDIVLGRAENDNGGEGQGALVSSPSTLNGHCGRSRWMTMGAGASSSEGRAGKEGWLVLSLDMVAVNG